MDTSGVKQSREAWLALTVRERRQHGGNDGYDDEPSAYYIWDSTVPNYGNVRAGDCIVIWDKKTLIGASIIQSISSNSGSKPVYSCPRCDKAFIKKRETLKPAYRCRCKFEFDTPSRKEIKVTEFRSRHDVGWMDLTGLLSGAALRALCRDPRSQLSLRQLRWEAFRERIIQVSPTSSFAALDGVGRVLGGGHRRVIVRVRVGQAAFRTRLLKLYGPVCAMTGPGPLSALEAAHLYSYAREGEHYERGGLLLRRDLHRLFVTVHGVD